jgi:hypothetical protein
VLEEFPFFNPSLWCYQDLGSGIESPDGEVQKGREGHPQQVSQHQAARHPVFFPEGYEGEQYGAPKEHDLGESQAGALQAEKNIRPGGIEGELDEEQSEGEPGSAKAALAPHPPGRNPHGGVKDKPDQADYPSSRRERGLNETGIPLPRRVVGADPHGAITKDNPGYEPHEVPFSLHKHFPLMALLPH